MHITKATKQESLAGKKNQNKSVYFLNTSKMFVIVIILFLINI